jgi:hypothetical protein
MICSTLVDESEITRSSNASSATNRSPLAPLPQHWPVILRKREVGPVGRICRSTSGLPIIREQLRQSDGPFPTLDSVIAIRDQNYQRAYSGSPVLRSRVPVSAHGRFGRSHYRPVWQYGCRLEYLNRRSNNQYSSLTRTTGCNRRSSSTDQGQDPNQWLERQGEVIRMGSPELYEPKDKGVQVERRRFPCPRYQVPPPRGKDRPT